MIKKDTLATDGQPESGSLERELLEQVQALHQSLLEENRQLRELLIAQLVVPASRATASCPAADDYLTRWEQRRRREAERLLAELDAGPARFRVCHPGDPQCLVGAASGGEAIAKYRRHFGILRTNHEFTVDDASSATTDGCGAGAN